MTPTAHTDDRVDPRTLEVRALAPPRGGAGHIESPPVSGRAVPDLARARILVVRADRLGDVMLSLPVLGALREISTSSNQVWTH